MPELIELKYEPAPNPFDDDFFIAKTIFSQLGISIKLGLSLRKMVIVPQGFIATIGPNGTTIRVQIILNRGKDLYEVSVGRQNRKTKDYRWTYQLDDVYCDQLTEVIKAGFERVNK
jgi:hypothetical protein